MVIPALTPKFPPSLYKGTPDEDRRDHIWGVQARDMWNVLPRALAHSLHIRLAFCAGHIQTAATETGASLWGKHEKNTKRVSTEGETQYVQPDTAGVTGLVANCVLRNPYCSLWFEHKLGEQSVPVYKKLVQERFIYYLFCYSNCNNTSCMLIPLWKATHRSTPAMARRELELTRSQPDKEKSYDVT